MTTRTLPAHLPPFAGTPRLPARLGQPPAWAGAAILLVAAFLIRLPEFGNPAIQIDEQFYLLVGDRMLHGAVPYIDIWDRKPIGLFLLYAAIRLLGGVGILQYQLVAACFAAGTAWGIARIARKAAGEWPAIASGLLYLLWIETVEGGGGQAPVFYNLLMVAAAALVLRAANGSDWRIFRRRSLAAMALVGVAMQIKYTVAVEGLFFGLVLTRQALRIAPPGRALRLSLLCAGTAMLPTLIALAYYARLGAAPAFLFANFTSIGLRAPPPSGGARLWLEFQHVLPLALCCAASWWQTRKEADPDLRQWRLFLACWLAAAVLGFACVGAFYYHYLLPVYVPLAIGAAPIFGRLPIGPVLAGLAMWIPFHAIDWPGDGERRIMRGSVEALAALVPPEVDRGCMQMLDGPPSLYLLRHACLAGRWPFPDHLVSPTEAHAIGINPTQEIRRLMIARPLVLVVGPPMEGAPGAALAMLRAGLAEGYRLNGTARYEGRTLSVYIRR
ncbi:ArnT family glycosyltransferase [Sphingomonas bacterium]|uniref:ArnT family glycosyltransferase n=1 Tax=Sphingomonas bacterium TaxID=1895847 RepID=UPI0015759FBD|nr:glycosyltransferase family 39 protein [Sphingomonas bacterium]